MKKIPVFAGILLSLLFLSGCYTPNMKGPCCSGGYAMNGTCEMYTSAGADEEAKTEMCNSTVVEGGCITDYCVFAEANKGKNATVYVKYTTEGSEELDCTNVSLDNETHPCNNIGYCWTSDGGKNASYPICSERSELEFDTECKTMLCGNIKYSPKTSFLPEPNKNVLYQGSAATFTRNLYNAMCNFYVLDSKTMRKLKKGSGIFVSTLRIGAGSSIDDYEEARLYFPLSDRFCGFASVSTANYQKDRYVNYVNLSDVHTICDSGGWEAPCFSTTENYTDSTPWGPTSYTTECAENEDGKTDSFSTYMSLGWNMSIIVTVGATGVGTWKFHDTCNSTYTINIYDSTGALVSSATNSSSTCGVQSYAHTFVAISNGTHTVNVIMKSTAGDWVLEKDEVNIQHCVDECVDFCCDCDYEWYDPLLYVCEAFCPICSLECTFGSILTGTLSCPDAFVDVYHEDWESERCGASVAKRECYGPAFHCNYYGPFDPTTLNNRSIALGCPDSVFPPAPDGNYILSKFTEGITTYTHDAKFQETYIIPDAKIYKYSLYGAYWNQVYTDSVTTSAADYECNSSTECISRVCAKDDWGYERGFCMDSSGNEVNCLCHEVGTRGLDGNEVHCDPVADNASYALLKTPVSTGIYACCEGAECMYSFACLAAGAPCGSGGTCNYIPIDMGDTFAGDIVIFDDEKGNASNMNAAGYALMNKSEFNRSMFAAMCGATGEDVPRIAPYEITDEWGKLGCLEQEERDMCMDDWYEGACSRKDVCVLSTQLTKITGWGAGKCAKDDGEFYGTAVNNFPQIKSSYGWCEPCTFLTMFAMNLDEYWEKYKDYDFACPSPGGGMAPIVVGVASDKCGGRIREYMSNLANLRRRIDNYLKAGVMPVVWFTEGETAYTNTYSSQYDVLNDCKKGTMPETSKVEDTIRQVILGNMFNYRPDDAPFFGNVQPSCTTYHNEGCGSGNPCIDEPISAAPSSESSESFGFGEEGGPSALGSSASEFSAESAEPAAGFLCLFWNVKDRDNMRCKWTGKYYFLKKAIGNSASMVVVATDDMDNSTAGTRAYNVKTYNCPNCLIAIYSRDLDETALSKIFGCSGGEMECMASGTQAWKYIDVILYDSKLNNDPSASYEEILNATVNKSRRMLQLYGKASMPYNFVIDESKSGWSGYDRTYEAMKYLLYNQSDIVTSGLFAFLYKKWTGADGEALTYSLGKKLSTAKDEKFCAFEKSVNTMLYPPKKRTMFTLVKSVNASDALAECAACIQSETMFGLCSRACENGANCTLPIGVSEPGDGYRCPANIAIEPCTLCNATQGGYVSGGSKNTSVWSTNPYIKIRIVYDESKTTLQMSDPDPGGGWIDLDNISDAHEEGSVSFCLYAQGPGCTSPAQCTTHDPTPVLWCSGDANVEYSFAYSLERSALCNITYEDGSMELVSFPFSQLSDVYGDVIASIPKQDRCCLTMSDSETNQSYNYTYTKSSADAVVSTPIRFPRSGNETLDCGLGADSGTFCGINIPIRDYTIECEVAGG